MLKTHWLAFQSALRAVEVLLSAALFAVLFPFGPAAWPPVVDAEAASHLLLGLIACAAWPVSVAVLGFDASQRRETVAAILPRLAGAGLACTMALAATAFVLSAPVPPTRLFAFGACQFVALTLLRLVILGGLGEVRRHGRNIRNVVIVGSGPRAHEIRNSIAAHPTWGLRIIAFVDDYEFLDDGRGPIDPLHKIADLPGLFRDNVIDEVIVAFPRSLFASLVPVVDICSQAGVPMTIPSDLFGDYLPPPRVSHMGSLSGLTFAPVHHNRLHLGVKRACDVITAIVALVLSSPIIAVAAVAIRATSRGPVFFRQTRCGLHGRPFSMTKLRTMVVGAEEQQQALAAYNECDGPIFKMKNDPRVTRVGRFLRRWSIDELPQIWNVLLGEMSIVGPRPPVPAEVARYENFERRRLSMRPGITCTWQIQGRNEIGFADWVKLDVEYIDSWSISRDFEIMLRTVPAVLTGRGAS
jgi:exopolysaccharide biosynthesis polyprenyl glycosylphosphotransferase